MTAPGMARETRPIDRKLRLAVAIAAVLLGAVLAGGVWLVVDQVREDGSVSDASASDWLVYEDAAQGFSISYPPDGRVDVVNGVAFITNRELACPACEPAPLRMFSLSITPDPSQVVSTGRPIEVGAQRLPGLMSIEGDGPLTARITYRAGGRAWQILATFTEPVTEDNPVLDQFLQMVRTIRHS